MDDDIEDGRIDLSEAPVHSVAFVDWAEEEGQQQIELHLRRSRRHQPSV